MALGLVREQAVAVSADVEEGEQLAIDIADEEGPAEQVEGEVIAGARQLGAGGDEVPGGQEKALDLRIVGGLRIILSRAQDVAELVLMKEHVAIS
jgi:hypothetical protein